MGLFDAVAPQSYRGSIDAAAQHTVASYENIHASGHARVQNGNIYNTTYYQNCSFLRPKELDQLFRAQYTPKKEVIQQVEKGFVQACGEGPPPVRLEHPNKQGVETDHRDKVNCIPLHHATSEEKFNTREAIQQANDGFDRVGMDARGENALMHAIRNSPTKGLAYLVEVLCYHGADVNAKNSSGRTALDLAKERTGSDYGEVQSTLLRYGAARATSYSVGSAASYYAGHLSPSTSPTHQVVPRRSGTMRTLSMAFLSALLALENRG
jgi:hypothetical protein